jgi:hypothetical protein
VYNLLIIIFGTMLFKRLPNKLGAAVGILIIGVGIAGGLMVPFQMDTGQAEPTVEGTIHIVLAAIIAPSTLVSTLLSAIVFRAGPLTFRIVFLILFSIILISGPIAAIGAGNDWRCIGLFERITIGAFLAWVVAVNVALLRNYTPCANLDR